MSEDLAHDAHLRAALRHAPDHALAPPSGLSQTILAAARQAHRPVQPTPAPSPPMRMRAASARPLRAWLRRLFGQRWAGAWAAGLVATLGLGLWLDVELRPTVERPAVVAMSSPQPETATRAEAQRDATSESQAATDDAPTQAAKATTAAPARALEKTDAPGTLRAAPGAEARVGKAAAVQRNQMAAGPQRQRDESVSRDAAARQGAAAPEPAAPPSVATAPGTDQPNDPSAVARVRAPATAEPPAAPAAEPTNEPPTSARSATGLHAALPDARNAQARKAELGEAVAAASPPLTLLRRAQAELATGSAVWTWSPPGSAAMMPFDAAAQAWLSRVVQGARGRWVDVGERGGSLDALEVRWWRDGWPHATLRIEADGLRWVEPGGRIRYAPLDTATLRQLRSF